MAKKASLAADRLIRAAALAVLAGVFACPIRLIAAGNEIKANCSDPRDREEHVYCFLAQLRCLPSYFGIDGTPDYPKALQCFESSKLWGFAALMYLDGEGTPRDLDKASAALKSWKQQGPDEFNPDQAAIMSEAIDKCKRHPRSCSRVDYCEHLEESTQEIEICGAVDELPAERNLARAITSTRGQLKPADRALFDHMIAEFKAYQMDDMQRQYQAWIDGSLRDVAGASQAEYVRENFAKLVMEAIKSRVLKPATIASYQAVQARLDREIARNLAEIMQSWQEDLRDPQWKGERGELKSKIEDYKHSAQESQQQWIKFRDSSAKLATSLYRGEADKFDPAVSMKATVTNFRIAELRYNPIGPGPN